MTWEMVMCFMLGLTLGLEVAVLMSDRASRLVDEYEELTGELLDDLTDAMDTLKDAADVLREKISAESEQEKA